MSGRPQQAGDDGTTNDVAGCGCSIVLLAIGCFTAARFGDDPANTGRSAIALLGGFCMLLALMVARQTWAERRARRRTWVAPVIGQRAGVSTWRDAELLAVRHMRALGFLDARDTGPGSDGGIDAMATGPVAQVKMHNKPVGRPDVQRLVGAAGGQPVLLFYSLSGFTSTAHTYADERGILLFGFDRAGTVRALNGAATRALRSV
ncbi:restriction endonuclease [Streptomyces flaveolus]|uniref:restriction endonuclease n=1 Tax=Streptomyces flaveolus TaxID=67297 RepID=UPI0033FFF515